MAPTEMRPAEAAGPSLLQSRPVIRARHMRRRSVWTGKGLFLVPALIYLAALTFFPMVELVRMSVSHVTPEVLYKPWPFVGLSEFNRAVSTADFREALFNTIVYVTVVLISGLVGGLPEPPPPTPTTTKPLATRGATVEK